LDPIGDPRRMKESRRAQTRGDRPWQCPIRRF
jgi:hypothetical protein